jgi:cell wall-associated NlpC family hydrolase
MRDLKSLAIATQVAWSFLGLPYKWGGDDPMVGFDCSGYVIEILKSVGILPRRGDWTAQNLHDRFRDSKYSFAEEGMLVFWRRSTPNVPPYKIIHVEYCLTRELSIGASGGGGSTITEQDAVEQNAYIKIRPFESRSWLL